MKIAVTGTSSGLGKYLLENLDNSFGASLRLDIENLVNKITEADILINLAYSNDTKQSDLFYRIFELWKNQNKTIINIGTSAITEVATFDPLYVTNKKHLVNLSNSLAAISPYKKLRVVNLNPGTLENNKIFGSEINKLKFDSLYKIIKFIIELPQEVEISDITIKSTQQRNQNVI